MNIEKFGRRSGEKVHAAAQNPDGLIRLRGGSRYYVLACTGRAVFGMLQTTDAVTCKACLKGIESGRIEVAA